jgi:hypothetical protein
MMQQYINGIRVANDVMMLRKQHAGSVAIVEGPSDARFYNRYFDKTCRVLPAFGKSNVIDAIIELTKRKAAGVLGIVDSDYTYLEKKVIQHPNILNTDFHDLETLLMLSPSLTNTLRELIPDDKIHLLENLVNSIRESLLAIGIEIGYLRWISVRENLGLNFDALPYKQTVNPNQKTADLRSILSSAKVASKVTKLAISDVDILSKTNALKAEHADIAHICQGHDLVFLLELVVPVVFDNMFGRNSSNSIRGRIRSDILSEKLRLGYEKAFFLTTKLYLAIKDWEIKNPLYKVIT